MKKEYLFAAGMAGACLTGAAVGFIFGTKKASKDCKETIEKEVHQAINKEIVNNTLKELEVKDLRKEVKTEAIEKVSNKIEVSTNNKLKEFNERLEVMEDIDAKKIDLAKVAITGVVTIATTLITQHYRKNNQTDKDALTHTFDYISNALNTLSGRIDVLEVK